MEDALIIHCDVCGERITKLGALLFSPPIDNICRKYHICVKCYEKIYSKFIFPSCIS